MVLTVSFVISLVTGLSCHHHQRDAKHHRQLDASVGASGPHDFAVRFGIIRPRLSRLTPPRPPHPAPNVRDDREAPLLRARDGAKCAADLGVRSNAAAATHQHDGQIGWGPLFADRKRNILTRGAGQKKRRSLAEEPSASVNPYKTSANQLSGFAIAPIWCYHRQAHPRSLPRRTLIRRSSCPR